MFSIAIFLFSEKSTDGSQASENWGLFMEICDVINDTDEGYDTYISYIN